MTLNLQAWPEPIVRVQSLSDSGIDKIPDIYIKPPSQRPTHDDPFTSAAPSPTQINIPVIDLSGLFSADASRHAETLDLISSACRDWGFFQAVNHGVPIELLKLTRETWREFFYLKMEEKQLYANTPATYEGYGSRTGVEKGAKLDWNDYFFLNYLPERTRDVKKWPADPSLCRELTVEYNEEMGKLAGRMMKALSLILGLEENHLQDAIGGEDIVACLRANLYPKCPQPDLTLGLSSHSDPGAITLLLSDDDVPGLQVRQADLWVTVNPVPNAIIVNMGDIIQVLSNGMLKSVEHRVTVNSEKERVSIVYFYNPRGDMYIEPAKELLMINGSMDNKDGQGMTDIVPLYPRMTFIEYTLYIMKNGPSGKTQVESYMCPK